ncbi:hypothetical protein GCM10007160_28230 [Litchfieldella qijiaojingensis]|uniref:Uncharacterized protein n=1 Tax=Litchfieldella qijiaojingensis TaxID=980347 RepID=A0ABQ2Z008_9GAMM|nr:hypothetical protein GCM10007160_28230 [Halomonas qijiaojingensis]
MPSTDTLNALKEWDDRLIQDAVDQLNQIGIVSDEDDQRLASIWIEF